MNALSSEELERMLGFAQAVEEERQIVVIVEFLDFDLVDYE